MVADTIAPKRKTKRSPPETAELPPGTTRFQGLALSNDHPLVKAFHRNGEDTGLSALPDKEAAVPGWSEIGVFSLELLERHPDNRVPAPADVAAIADSLKEEGQLEGLVLRKLSDMRYQILSGETRWLAAKQIKWKTVRARWLECSDARALQLLALFNAKRKDLDAIQKAKMIQRLCQSESEGGGGMKREAAAKVYELESASAASNLVRLLELPEVWQKRVAAGEIAQSLARELLPIRQLPAALKDAESKWKSKSQGYWNPYESRGQLTSYVERLIAENVRRFDEKYWHSGSGGSGDFKVMIHPDDIEANRARLGITTISFSERGKSTDLEVATNVKLFDELQTKAVEKHLASKRKAKAGKAADRKISAADAREDAKEKAEHLQRRRDDWRHAWIGSLVAERLEKRPDVVMLLLCWMGQHGVQNMENGRLRLDEVAVETAVQCGASKVAHEWRDADVLGTLLQLNTAEQFHQVAREMVRQVLVAPQPSANYAGHRIEPSRLDAIASRCGIDIGAEWRKAHDSQRPEIDEFFSLHTQDQLIALGKELGVPLEKVAGKAGKVTALLAAEDVPLPKCIKELEAAGKKAKKGGK